MPGTLFVVATPIGNLEDVTLRALRILRDVSVIAAEDTRRTSRLLQHYSISTPTTSLHEHNEAAKTPALLKRLEAGESVALVSDAGTPVVADPGSRLVAAAHAAGLRVEPIPGPSAVMAALSASGLGGDQFVFAGFPPAKSQQRRKWLQGLAAEPRPVVVYEAPHRIRDTLQDILDIFGNRTVALGRELTKAHEELVVRQISVLISSLGEPRGEYTVVIGLPDTARVRPQPPSAARMSAEFGQIVERSPQSSRRDAIRQLADKYGLPTRAVYALVEEGQNSG
ncbi:MAG TPA: 16S rRNA (cytidine(1402)-2'-O)-methyltransferase [Vicinamibacterales bacterium]|nr:16S rRNA (cytidine(1402)-2'-O)-methyltransferase [Vicinamibacterales bacterium]